jgi:hypothetical protein
LFAVDELIAEFQKPLPQPQPQIVYDRGVVRDGARLAQWLREPPHSPAAQHWCPVTRKVIQRYFTEVCQIGNRFFQKPSGAWQLSYAGETVELPNRRGLQHLARLIRYQGKELHCALLANGGVEPAATLAPPTPALSAAQLAAEHLVIERVPAREESARRQVLRKLDADLQALKTDRADADAASDSAELARLEAAIEEKKQEIAKVIRWFQKHGAIRAGKTTGAGNPRQEKDRQAVSTAIRRSLAVLKTKHPKLWQHLAGTLQLGFYCQYAPATHLHWRL